MERSGKRSVPASALLLGFSRLILAISLSYVFGSLLVYAFVGGDQHNAFAMIGISKLSPSFADLRWVASLSECGVDLQELASKRLWGCDPYGRGGGLGYPPISVEVARFLGVKGSHTGLLGFLIGISTLGVVFGLCRRLIPKGFIRNIAFSLLLIGFPLQLVLERGNIDSMLFLMVATLASTLACNSFFFIPVQAAIAWMMVAIKLYPAAGLLGWVVTALLPRRIHYYALAAVVLGTVAGVITVWPWFQQSGSSAAQPLVGGMSHGLRFELSGQYRSLASLLPGSGGAFRIQSLWLTAPLFLLALIFGIRTGLERVFAALCGQMSSKYISRFVDIFVRLSAFIWLGCYLLSSSFDYRMIFAYPPLIGIVGSVVLLASQQGNSRQVAIVLVGLSAVLLVPFFELHLGATKMTFLASYSLSLMVDFVLMPITAGLIASMVIAISPRGCGKDSRFNPDQVIDGGFVGSLPGS